MSTDPNKPADEAKAASEGLVPAAEPTGVDAPKVSAEGAAPPADPVAPAADAALTGHGSPLETGAVPANGATGAAGSDGAGGPRGGGTAKRILIGVLVVLLVGAGIFLVRYLASDAANAEAGDCVGITEQSGNSRVDVETLDCGDAKASYKVGKVLASGEATCPEEGLYTEVTPATGVGDGYKLCLLPNMAEGACYKPDESGAGFVKTECTGAETIKVTKIVNGSTDTSACPDGAGMSYPEPAVTYCLAPAES